MLERVVLGLCAAALFLLMVVGAADIVLGKVFGRYLGFKVDMSEVLLAMSVFLAWAVAQKQDAHIRVEIFISRAPQVLKLLSSIVTALCGLLVFGLISYGAYNMAARSYRIGETSAATLGFPIWPAKIICAAAAVLTITILAYQLVRTVWTGVRNAGQSS